MPQFSKRVSAGSRIYFIDAHKDSKGQPYLTITELAKATNKRSTIFVHPEDFDKFADAMNEAMDFIDDNMKTNVKV